MPPILNWPQSHKQNDYHSLACFPWTGDSLSSLWGGVQDLELISSWKNAVKPWVGAIAVGATGCLCIYPKLATEKPLPVPLAEVRIAFERLVS